jgi:hypothetical protein
VTRPPAANCHTRPSSMGSWNDLPRELRHRILSEFVTIVLDEYNRRRNWFKCGGLILQGDWKDWLRKLENGDWKRDEDWDQDEDAVVDDDEDEVDEDEDEDEVDEDEEWTLPKYLRSQEPLPLAWFASALQVSHDFSNILNRVTIDEYTALQKVKQAQCDMLEFTLNAHELMYMNFDGQFHSYLRDITAVVGNFWKNYDCFNNGVNILSRIHHLLHQRSDPYIAFLFPVLQHLSQATGPIKEPPITHTPMHLFQDPDPHPATYFVEQLYYETCSRYVPVSGGKRMDTEINVFRVIGISSDYAEVLPSLKCCPAAKEIDASPSREWLAVSFGNHWLSDMDYLVNIEKNRLYEFVDQSFSEKWDEDGMRVLIPGDWKDVSDKMKEFWAYV